MKIFYSRISLFLRLMLISIHKRHPVIRYWQFINTFGAEVAKSRHNGLSAEVDYSRPPWGECCRLYSLSTEVA